MSQTIENRIVEMQFENKQFESGVQESLSTLDKLKKSLNFDDASKNLQNFSQSATKNLDLSGLSASVERLSDKFSISGIAGMETIRKLTDFAISAGKTIASALDAPFAQIRQGGWRRAMNIEDAKFQLKGLGVAWESVADDINYAVADTAFGLDAAAKACSQLTASGIQAGDAMKAALRGISGVASMGNTEYENIADIFTKAAGNGKVMAMEFNRISQYGLNARASVAKFYNAINAGDESVKDIPDNIKKRVKKVTKGLKVTEADISDFASHSKIDFQTFAYAMDSAFGEHAKAANETFMGSLRNIKAALSKIGAEFATPLIKGAVPIFNEIRIFINELKKRMQPVYDVFANITKILSDKVSKKLENFRLSMFKLGGFEHIGNAVKNIFTSILKLIAAVSDAFRSVFPSTNNFGKNIESITSGIENFTKKLVISDKTMVAFRNIMVVVFNILKGVGNILTNLLPIISKVFSVILKIVSVVISLAAALVKVVSQLDIVKSLMSAIQKSGGVFAFVIEKLKNIFLNLKAVLTDTTTVTGRFFDSIKRVATVVVAVIGGSLYIAFMKIKEVLSYFNTKDPLGSLLNGINGFINKVRELPIVKDIFNGIAIVIENISIAFGKVIGLVSQFITNLRSGMSVIKAIGTALSSVVTGIIATFGKLIDTVSSFFSVFSKDRVIEETIEMPIANAGEALVGMEHELTLTRNGVVETTSTFDKAKASITNFGKAIWDKIKTIRAGQVLLFALGTTITILTMNISKFVVKLTSLTSSFTNVGYSISNFLNNFGKKESSFAEVMITASIAIAALTASLWALSKIEPEALKLATTCLGALLGVIGLFSVLGKNGAGPFAAAMAAFSGGILLLVFALYAIDQVNMENIKAKVLVLVSIVGTMLLVSLALSKLTPTLASGGIGLLAFAGSVYILAKAINILASSDLYKLKDCWLELSAVIVAFGLFATAASGVGLTAALGLLGFILVLKVLLRHVDAINKYFGSLGNAFSSLADMLKRGVSYLYNGLKKVADDVSKSAVLGKIIQSSVITIIGSIIGLILALGHAGKGIKKAAVGFVLVAAAIAGLMYVTVKISELAKAADPDALNLCINLLNNLLKFVGIIGAINAAISIWGKEGLDNTMLKDMRKLISSMAILLLAIGGFAAMVGSLTADEFARVKDLLIATEIIVGVIAAVASIIAACSAKMEGTGPSFSTFIGVVLLIGSLVATIAVLMFTFSQVDFEKDADKLWTIGGAFGLIVLSIIGILASMTALVKASSQKGSLKIIPVLLSFAAMLAAVGGAVWLLLKEIPDRPTLERAGIIAGGLITFLASIISIIIVLEWVSKKLLNTEKRQDVFTKSLSALGLMILAIIGFAAMFTVMQLAEVDTLSMYLQGGALLGVLAGLAALVMAIQYFSKDKRFTFTKASSENFNKTMKYIGLAIVAFLALAAVFSLMHNVDAGRVWGQATAITFVLYALSALVLGIQNFMKKADVKNILKVEGTIGILIGMFGAISLILALMNKLDTGTMVKQAALIIGVITVLMIMVGIMGTLMSKLEAMDVYKVEGFIAVMIALFAGLALVFKYIVNDIQLEGLSDKIFAITLTLFGLEALCAVAAILGNFTKQLIVGELALAGMVGLFHWMAYIFKTINEIDVSGIETKKDSIIGAMWSLVGILAVLGVIGALMVATGGVGALAVGAGLVAMAAMVGIFHWVSSIFDTISKMDVNGFESKKDSIISAMWSLVAILSVLGVASPFGLAALASMPGLLLCIYGLSNLVDALNNIQVSDASQMQIMIDVLTSVMWSLIAMLAVMGLASAFIAASLLAMPSLLLIIEGLSNITTALNSMQGLTVNEIGPVIAAVENLLEGLVSILTIMGVLSPLIAASSIAMPALLDLINSLVIMSISIKALEAIDPVKAKQSIDVLIDMLWSLMGLGAANGVLNGIGNELSDIAKGITELGQACVIASTGAMSFNTAIMMLNASLLSASSTLATTASGLAETFKNSFEGTLEPEKWGRELVEQFAGGMNSNMSVISEAANNVAKTIWSYLHFSLGAEVGYLAAGSVFHWGKGLLEQYGLGIEGEEPNLENILNSIGSKAKNILGDINFDGIIDLSNAVTGEEGVYNTFMNILKAVGMVKSEIASMTSSWSKGLGTLADMEYELKRGMDAKVQTIDKATKAYERLSANGTRSGENAKKKAEETTKALEAQQKKLDELYGTTKDANDITKKFTDTLGDLGEGGGKAGKGVKEAKDAIADFYDMIESSISLFDKFEEAEAMSTSELLENMASQITGLANWSTQIQELASKGIDQGLLHELANMGPSGQKYVKAFVNMTADELAQANNLYQQSLLLPQHVTAQVFGSFEIAGMNATEGFVNGLDHDAIREEGIAFAHSFLDNFRAAMGIHSPSTETEQAAINCALGFIKGLQNTAVLYNLNLQIHIWAMKILDWFNEYLPPKEFEGIGIRLLNNIEDGIKNQEAQSSIFDTIKKLCDDMIAKAKAKFQTANEDDNPGGTIVDNLSKGITNKTKSAVDAMGKTTDKVLDEMRSTINKANDALIDGVNDPVIKPVLDLSDVKSGSRTLNDMLSRNSAISASGSFRSLQNGQWNRHNALVNAAMDNTDVVGAIGILSDDIMSLKEAMTNITMVLDTGKVVGAITPMVDKQLGVRQMYAGRGI